MNAKDVIVEHRRFLKKQQKRQRIMFIAFVMIVSIILGTFIGLLAGLIYNL